MKATINNALLTKLKSKNKPYDVRDDKIIGFLIRVNISGKLLYMREYARGKRVTIGKVGVLTTMQARDRALAILGDAAKGLDPRDAKKKDVLTLKQFMNNEYAPWVKEHRKAGIKTLKHITRCFIEPFGNKLLSELTPVLIDQWRTQRLKTGLTIETVNRDIATFKAALTKAVLWSFIESHPLERLKLLKSDRTTKVRFLSSGEEQRLREATIVRESRIKADRTKANQWRQERRYALFLDLNRCQFADHLRPMILLSINTGLRQGETFSLRWKNVNFERAMLTIEGAYAKSGKTRHIPLNTEAVYVLKSWHQQTGGANLVFPNKEGVEFDTVKKSWAGVLKAANIENFRWHDLRHHFASKLVMAGVDLNTVRELLGHSDMAMTLRYAHLAPEHKANAVEKLVHNVNFTAEGTENVECNQERGWF
jgi:integrase